MNQLNIEKIHCAHVPVLVVHPIRDTGNPVILYHGWSSRSEYQITKAGILAMNGYTVYIPEAASHGERGPLSDYYRFEDYSIFWDTILHNMEEFPLLQERIGRDYKEKPFLMGHSMGGLSVLGIGAVHGDKIRGIISFNGSGDWLMTHLFLQARFGMYMERNWPLYDGIEKKSPINHVDVLKNIPIFMTNGEIDSSVDPRAQAHFAEALERAGGKGTRITYPHQGHFVTTNMMDDAMKWMEGIDR